MSTPSSTPSSTSSSASSSVSSFKDRLVTPFLACDSRSDRQQHPQYELILRVSEDGVADVYCGNKHLDTVCVTPEQMLLWNIHEDDKRIRAKQNSVENTQVVEKMALALHQQILAAVRAALDELNGDTVYLANISSACTALANATQHDCLNDAERGAFIARYMELVDAIRNPHERDFAFQHAFNKHLQKEYGMAVLSLSAEVEALKADNARFKAAFAKLGVHFD